MRSEAGHSTGQRLVTTALILALNLGPCMLAAQTPPREVRVTASAVNVRLDPSPEGRVLFQVKAGEVLKVVNEKGDWLFVETSAGLRGYVFRKVTEVVNPPAPAPASTPPPAPAVPSGQSVSIDHKEVGCVVAEQYPKLDACFLPASSLGKAQIHFRAQDSDPWYAVEMKTDGPCFSAYLPKPQKTTTEIQYYVDAIDTGFAEVERPDTSPAGAYRVRVVRSERDCDRMKRLAASFAKLAKPIMLSVAKDAAGRILDIAAAKLLEAHLVLAGFSAEGVIVASTGAVASSAASTAASSSGAAGASAGGAAAGGAGLSTAVIVGGVAAAAVGGIAVAKAASSSTDTGSTTPAGPTCSVGQIVANSGGQLVAVGQSVCGQFFPFSRTCAGVRVCFSGICTQSCQIYYEVSDGRRFSCPASCSGADTNGLANCIGNAANNLINACPD